MVKKRVTRRLINLRWYVNLKKTISMLFVLFIYFGIILCQDPPDPPDAVTKVSTSAANWLKIESGVRGISMGGAQAASGRGLSGAYYNPASLAFIESSEAYFSKSQYLAGITHIVSVMQTSVFIRRKKCKFSQLSS